MASSKTLIRSTFSLLNRINLHTISPPPSSNINLPFLKNLQINQTNIHHSKKDDINVTKLCSEGVLYPTGLPSIEFLLPDGDDSSSSKPILLLPKRTYQPSIIKRKRNHGFFARKATVGERRVIKRRIAKGGARITA